MPLITFHQLVENPRPPIRATKNAAGHLPDRHHRCEPVRAASGLGWYLFLPFDFQIVFDGTDSIISLDNGDTWYPLDTIQFPNFVDIFNQNAPDEAKGFSPPFCSMVEDHSHLQIWSGYLVRTEPDYSLLVRSPANIVPSMGYFPFEGIVETDNWFGPLFINVKLIRTDVPIRFHAHRPFIQLTPIHRREYADSLLNNFEVHKGFKGLTESDWKAFYHTVVQPNAHPVERRMGAYAAAARKRRAAEGES